MTSIKRHFKAYNPLKPLLAAILLLALINPAPTYAIKLPFSPPKSNTISNSHKDLASHGIVLISITSDYHLKHKLWDDLTVINADSKETYLIKAALCQPSACFYAGRLLEGTYFLEKVQAYEYKPPNKITSSISIRNAIGSFKIKTHLITDLGMLGIYSTSQKTDHGDAIKYAFFQRNAKSDHLATLYKHYAAMINHPGNQIDTSSTLAWDDTDTIRKIKARSIASSIHFTRLPHTFKLKDSLYFPSGLGALYQFTPEKKFKMFQIGTTSTLRSVYTENSTLYVGAESGKIFSSQDNGQTWIKTNQFDVDETVIRLLKNGDQYCSVNIKGLKRLLIYCGSSFNNKLKKVNTLKISLGLTEPYLQGFNRIRLSRSNVDDWKSFQLNDSHLLQKSDRQFYKLSPNSPKPSIKRFSFPVHDLINRQDKNFTINAWMTKPVAKKHFLKKDGKRKKQSQRRTALNTINASLARFYIQAKNSGDSWKKLAGFYGSWSSNILLTGDGQAILVFRKAKYEGRGSYTRSLPPKLISIDLNTGSLKTLRDLNSILYYYDTALEHFHNGWLMVDRIYPQVYYTEDKGNTWSNYKIMALLESLIQNNKKAPE